MAEVLIEGCNAVASGSDFNGSEVSGWTSLNVLAGGAIPTSVAALTEGSNAWRCAAVDAGGGTYYNGFAKSSDLGGADIDLSAYATISIDVSVATINAGDYLVFGAYSTGGTGEAAIDSVAGATGSDTLTIDISGLADRSQCQLFLLVSDTNNLSGVSSSSTSTFTADNIRGDTGSTVDDGDGAAGRIGRGGWGWRFDSGQHG